MTTITIVIQNAPYKENHKAWHALRFAGAALANWVKNSDHVMVF
jgi:sulfur relay (sulfurtransferase) complex TusBCD TusD component (DsrE family)